MRDKKKKWIGIIAILLIVAFIFFAISMKNNNKQDDFFGEFFKELYNISYDEYSEIMESKSVDFEKFIRRDKFEKFFTPKGFENFFAEQFSVLYLREVLDNKCDVELVSYSGELTTEPYQFYYEYEADKFFYNYEVEVNIVSLTDGDKTTKREMGAISGYIIDGEYKIDSFKSYYQLFR